MIVSVAIDTTPLFVGYCWRQLGVISEPIQLGRP